MHARTTTEIDAFTDPERRVDGEAKVTGRMQYTADFARPGTLWAAFTRSPHAHARIVAIDTTEARAVPGVHAVLTSADIGHKRFGRQLCDWPVLSIDTVRFIGERVVAIAAETREAAEVAARTVHVTYEPLPAVLDAAAALQPDAPILHPDWDTYSFPAYAGKPRPLRPHPNIQGTLVCSKGDADLDAIFARAAHVFEHHFDTPRQHCGYIEPRATLVWIDDAGTVHVHTPNKHPFTFRAQLARAIDVPPERIVFECTAIGGDFGGKGLTLDEYPCYFLAKATGRPVRSLQGYAHELRDGTTRHQCTMTLRTACDAEGTFLAHHATVAFDGGAYAAGKPRPQLIPGFGYGMIPYRVPNVRYEACTVYTNTPPAAHMRGPAEVQTFFAWEQHVDAIAAALAIDPIALRQRNVVVDGDAMLTGEPIERSMGRAVLDALQREIDRTPAIGARGVSLTCSHTGGGKTSLKIRAGAAGVEVITGVADQGAGTLTLLQRVVANALAIDRALVHVRQGNTSEAFSDPGAGASRVTHIVGRAAEDAASKLKTLLEERSGMTLRDGRFYATDGRSTAFAEIAAQLATFAPVETVGAFDSDPPGVVHIPDYTFGAYAIDVSVDAATGAITLHGALLVADIGTVINPLAHRGQIDGGFAFGLGNTLMEELALDEDGKILNANLAEYKLPTIRDVPPLRVVAVDAPPGHGPSGAKMAGELSNSGVAPAIANAVYQAAGVRVFSLPLTAERIFTALSK